MLLFLFLQFSVFVYNGSAKPIRKDGEPLKKLIAILQNSVKIAVLILTAIILLVITSIVYWFLRVKNLIDSKMPVRRRSGRIEVPIYTYGEQKGGKTVVLIGNMHIGDKKYYQETMDIINSLSGQNFVFTYEMIKKDDYELTSDEKTIMDELLSLREFMDDYVIPNLNLANQKEGIKYDPAWTNTDMSLSELVKKISLIGYKPVRIPDPPEEAHRIFGWLFNKILMNLPLLTSLPKSAVSPIKGLNGIILDERNDIAVAGILNQLEDHDRVASLWGAMHLPGIGQLLESHGFKRTGIRWISAYYDRRFPFPKFAKTSK